MEVKAENTHDEIGDRIEAFGDRYQESFKLWRVLTLSKNLKPLPKETSPDGYKSLNPPCLKGLIHRHLSAHLLIFNKGKESRPKDNIGRPNQAVVLVFSQKGEVQTADDHENRKDIDAPLGASSQEHTNLPRIHVFTFPKK
ncbi:hypothetical protein ACQ4M4_19555 [Leptolyngbya sp. AN02str]|uniref:hypothetical protein n=1 Tax=Leptolyngbya sp. AN02str TaxID=3423363 RepID=UPI003D323875